MLVDILQEPTALPLLDHDRSGRNGGGFREHAAPHQLTLLLRGFSPGIDIAARNMERPVGQEAHGPPG